MVEGVRALTLKISKAIKNCALKGCDFSSGGLIFLSICSAFEQRAKKMNIFMIFCTNMNGNFWAKL